MPLVALAVKLRAIALSEISQMLNEILPYLRLRVSPAGLPATPRLGVQRNFARRDGLRDYSCPANRHLAHKEGAGSKTVLIMQSIVKSLGHM